MRKKLIGFLAVLTCFVFLTACGSSAQNDEVQEIPQETQSLLYSNTEMTAQQMDQVVTNGSAEDYKDYATVYSGIQSWESAKEEIGNIAWECGFSDISYFSNCFKKQFGVTPTEFRET